MMTMYPEIGFTKVSPDAKKPTKAHPDDAGFDLCSTEDFILRPGESRKVGSGIAVKIPTGFVGLLLPRSGLGMRGLVIKNGTGVIDAGYIGEIGLTMLNNNPITSNEAIEVQKGDRIAQLLVVPIAMPTLVEVVELGETDRGSGGFGSTGVRERL